ncbi:hypothetical protein [Mesorhizobium sp. M2E.F.Ca.ET.219.01.1.1]|uniref:hypothetical protein n=1 Tax=Mesorhizobium sp. M2E.F.Ca.ET.219.01.1.1 TaxID=2500530 RepID=UPI00187D4F92|nr:hypothetical protein [Mesorhizobium sp. M2E.F.Ca.ET.219.01.1.1]
MWFLSPQPLPGHPPDLAIALEFKLVPSRSVMAGGVTAAKRPAFLRKVTTRLSFGNENLRFPFRRFIFDRHVKALYF